MTELLRDWVRDIFIVAVGLYFVELVVPQGSMRKYIRFIFSIMILSVVLSPLAYLWSGRQTLESFSQGKEAYGQLLEQWEAEGAGQKEDRELGELDQIQKTQLEQIYSEKLSGQIYALLENRFPQVRPGQIRIFLEDTAGMEDFGKVREIVIKIREEEYVNSIRSCIADALGMEEDKIRVTADWEGEAS